MKTTFALIAILLSLACVGRVTAANAASYVVLSLVDHQLMVGTVDVRNNKSQWVTYPRRDGAFDFAALKATDAAIRRLQPDATVVSRRTADPRIYALQRKWIEGDSIDVAQLVDLLKSELADEPDTHLVVIAAHRADIMLPGFTVFGGAPKLAGKASGLGFYVETNLRVLGGESRELSFGFIAPFANFRMVLIDPRAMTIEANVPTAAGRVITAARSANRDDPWNAISDRERIQYLESLLTSEINRMTPILLQERKR